MMRFVQNKKKIFVHILRVESVIKNTIIILLWQFRKYCQIMKWKLKGPPIIMSASHPGEVTCGQWWGRAEPVYRRPAEHKVLRPTAIISNQQLTEETFYEINKHKLKILLNKKLISLPAPWRCEDSCLQCLQWWEPSGPTRNFPENSNCWLSLAQRSRWGWRRWGRRRTISPSGETTPCMPGPGLSEDSEDRWNVSQAEIHFVSWEWGLRVFGFNYLEHSENPHNSDEPENLAHSAHHQGVLHSLQDEAEVVGQNGQKVNHIQWTLQEIQLVWGAAKSHSKLWMRKCFFKNGKKISISCLRWRKS